MNVCVCPAVGKLESDVRTEFAFCGPSTKKTTEHVLKQYEQHVAMHRDLANEKSRVTFKNEGRQSKILRHEDPGRTQEYLVCWHKWSTLVGGRFPRASLYSCAASPLEFVFSSCPALIRTIAQSEFDHYEACYTVKRNLFPVRPSV